MAKYDLELVRSAAGGRWVELLSSLGGVSADLLDGRQHACPKLCMYGNKPGEVPGGEDRFRALEIDKGALYCNCCFREKNGDGFAALQWLTGKGFGEVLEMVAKHLGIKQDKKKKANPAEHLEFLLWNETTVGLWCEKKPPITPDAVKQVGGRIARYRGEYTVIAIPVWGTSFDNEDPVGWAMYRADGGMLPYYKKKGESPEWKKILLAPGSNQGMIGDPRQLSALVARQASSETTDHSQPDVAATTADTWSKLEGPSDLLSALSQAFPSNYRFWTTANGSMEIPLDWIIGLFKDLDCLVCHDCDVPGQQGATWVEQRDGRRPGWAPRLATVARSVKNIVLPFPIEPTHGPDIRDFFNGGGTVQGWLDLVDDATVLEKKEIAADDLVEHAEDSPKRLARVNLEEYRKAGRDLIYWNNEWYQYKGTHYTKIDYRELRPRVREAIEAEFERWWFEHRDRQSKPVSKVSGSLVRDVIESLESLCYTRRNQKLNHWLDGSTSNDCVALQNGILSFHELFKPEQERDNSKVLIPHTPRWFSSVCLPYAFDPSCDCPSWKKFLEEVFNGDHESIETLQQWFGLMLTPTTIHEKMLTVIGPTRSGKGTIQKVLINLLGRDTVATPSIKDFEDKYIKHGWLDKTAVIISDARFSGRTDSVGITEMLLSITGGDPQDIQRKYLSVLPNVQMSVRFTLFSNVVPRLSDGSAAMVGRVIMLSMPNSYLGKEDLTLADRLFKEMSGILNWAIAGRYLLQKAGKFKQPASGQHLIDSLRKTVSPIAGFVKDCCVQSGSVETKELYDAYCQWCEDNEEEPIKPQWFGRRLRDVNHNITSSRATTGFRSRIYKNISLNASVSAMETGF